jgi:hypothetical protein
MNILSLILVLVIVGLLLWVINTYIPMAPNIKRLLNIVVVIFLIIWLLKVFGLFASLSNIKI